MRAVLVVFVMFGILTPQGNAMADVETMMATTTKAGFPSPLTLKDYFNDDQHS